MPVKEIFTTADLKLYVSRTGSHFFDRKTLAFFGDTMKNYGIRATKIRCHYDNDGEYVDGGCDAYVWELYRKKPVKHGLTSSAYFDKVTYTQRYPIEKI